MNSRLFRLIFRWQHLELLLLLCLSVAVYHSLFSKELFDYELGLLSKTLTISDLEKFFERMLTVKGFFHRPLSVFTYAITYHFWQENSLPYLLTNLAIHVANVVLVYFLARHFVPYPFLAALFFAVHPLNSSAVSLLHGRNYSLATLFMLPALILFLRWYPGKLGLRQVTVLALLFLLMVLSKQTLIFFPVILFFYTFLQLEGKELRKRLCSGKTLLFVGAVAAIAAAFVINYGLPYAENAPVSSMTFFLSQLANVDRIAELLLLPLNISILHELPFYSDPLALPVLLGGAFILFCLALCFCYRRESFAFLLGSFFIALVPTNSFVPKNEVISEWRFYPSMVFFSILIVYLLLALMHVLKRRWGLKFGELLPLLVFVGYLGVLSKMTLEQNEIYRDEVSIYGQVLENYPNNFIASVRFAYQHYKRQNWTEALEGFRHVRAIRPDLWWAPVILEYLEKKRRGEEVPDVQLPAQ